MIEIREAKIDDIPELVKLYENAWEGKYPFSYFLEESELERLLKNNGCVWMLALDGSEIVGSAACVHNRWNNSTDFGKGAIKKGYWNRHVGTEISKRVVERAFEQDFDICWGLPRNKAVYNVVTNLGFEITGYMPGILLVDFREIYLFAMKLSEDCKKKRITPINKSNIYNLPLVKSINEKLFLKDNPGEYPKNLFAGNESEATNVLKFRHVKKHSSAFIVASDFTANDLCYIECDVLVDKAYIIKTLQLLGFAITAYLPAWCGTEQRFDCIKMARQFENYSSHDKFILELKERIDRELQNEPGQ